MKLKTMSVSALNTYIKRNFDNDFILSNVHLTGEISNFKAHTSGHLYFSLKDDQARVQCVMFRQDAQALAMIPEDGVQVNVKGRVSVYIKDGSFQLYVREMEEAGIGPLFLEFQRNKEKLFQEGLFREERKKPLPFFPRRVVVVTSATGAAVQDVLRVVRNRAPGIDVVVVPTLVQGEEAREAIVAALKAAQSVEDADVLLLVRGGGSFEDLSAFNDLELAYAIADARLPVVTGIGHETDSTIADFVADRRCATPSHAAETAVPDVHELKEGVAQWRRQLRYMGNERVTRERERLMAIRRTLQANHPRVLLVNEFLKLDELKLRFNGIIMHKAERERSRLETLSARVAAHNPQDILQRGYALVLDEKNHVVRSTEMLLRQARIKVRLKDGETLLKVVSHGKKEEDL